MNSFGIKVGSCLVATVMFLHWSVAIAQGVFSAGANHCGDGVLRVDLGEMCDDGNYLDGDGCNRNCQEEHVAEVVQPQVVQPQVVQPQVEQDTVHETNSYKVFMKGSFSHTVEVEIAAGLEVCDYGVDNGVMCEPGYGGKCYYCTTSCTLEEVTGATCGDGIVHHLYEQCDDGNLTSGDGCSSQCDKENILVVQPINTSETGITDLVETIVDPSFVKEVVVIQEEVLTPPTSMPPVLNLAPVELPVVQVPKKEMTPLVLENIAPSVSLVPAPQTQEEYLPEQVQFRQNMIVRTSPVHKGIGVTSPYPKNLSKTGASMILSSKTLFMWIFSGLCMFYTMFLLFASPRAKLR